MAFVLNDDVKQGLRIFATLLGALGLVAAICTACEQGGSVVAAAASPGPLAVTLACFATPALHPHSPVAAPHRLAAAVPLCSEEAAARPGGTGPQVRAIGGGC